MASRARPPYPSAIFIEPLDKNPAEIGPGVFLPQTRYRATLMTDDLEITIEVEVVAGETECRSLNLKARPSGRPAKISSGVLRAIPLGTYLTWTLEAAGFPFSVVDGEEVQISTQAAINSRKRRPQSELLPIVVNAYREALADRSAAIRAAPTQHVADVLHYERGHISRLLSEARKQGLLGPAKVGRPGESASPELAAE